MVLVAASDRDARHNHICSLDALAGCLKRMDATLAGTGVIPWTVNVYRQEAAASLQIFRSGHKRGQV